MLFPVKINRYLIDKKDDFTLFISIREDILKTHFGLHNTLMTLSSLEIRNFGA